MYGFKECSSCVALYNKEHCCSNVSSVDNFVRNPNPISYDETPRNCSKRGGPFGGLYCRQCTCERCRRNYTDDVCALCCYEVEKSFVNDLNPNSFIDSPNIFNPPPQPQMYSCEFCGNNAHYGYDCPPQKKLQQLEQVANLSTYPSRHFNSFCYDDDDDEEYTIAITSVLPTVEPNNSLTMGDEHLDTIPKTESNEFIKSSVEDLVPILSESEGISDSMCDVPFCENYTPLEASKDHSDILLDSNDEYSSSEDNSLYSEDIDYVEASPPDSELVNLEEVKDPENGEIDTDILLTIKDDIIREKLLNINLLIAKIEALKDNPTPSFDFVTKSPSTSPNSFIEETNIFYNSLPETETFCFNLEEKSSGNPTSYTNLSLPDYEAFFCDSEPDSGDFTMDAVEDIFDNPTREPRVHVPNVLPTHPTLHLDLDFTLSRIFIEVQSKRFLSPNEFSISFIRDPLSLVFDTLLSFSSKNEDNVLNPGFLASNEEKSPHLLSHWGFNPSKIISEFSESPMIYGWDIPILDVPFLHFYPP
ncbi:hypothetical protein Tco_1268789 [Tanacetum coccineum]